MEWSFLRNFAITLFALVNPLGMLPIFISYTAREGKQVQRIVAFFVSLTVINHWHQHCERDGSKYNRISF
jgi:small neutral amino acid transporter SnatA (MarC family)